MSSFPKLSYICPIPWSTLAGEERRKFCEKCGLHVTNLSELGNEERETLLQRAKTESICVSFYRRLTGEYVSPEHPLTREERSKIRQYGIAALSAGALALAAGCASVLPVQKETTPPQQPVGSAAEKIGGDDVIVLQAFGMICVEPPKKK